MQPLHFYFTSLLLLASLTETYVHYILLYLPNISKGRCVCVLVAQSCLTLWNLMDCNPPGSSVHRIFQARILEWIAIPFSRGSSRLRDQTWVPHIVGKFFTIWATRKPKEDIVEHFSWHDCKSWLCFWHWIILGVIFRDSMSYHKHLCDVKKRQRNSVVCQHKNFLHCKI